MWTHIRQLNPSFHKRENRKPEPVCINPPDGSRDLRYDAESEPKTIRARGMKAIGFEA